MGYRVYISGPMTGKDYKNRFVMAAVALEQGGNVTVNAAKIVTPSASTKEHMEVVEEFLDKCDAILFLPGWKDSQKCHAEMAWAINNKMIITFEGGRGCQNPSRPEHGTSRKKPGKKFMRGIKDAFSVKWGTILPRK